MSTPTQLPPEKSFLGELGPGDAEAQGATPAGPPPSRLPLAIVAIVLFLPLGIVALINSIRVGQRLAAGDRTGAVQASRNVKLFGLWGVVVGGVSAVLTGIVVFGVIMASQVVGGALIDPEENVVDNSRGGATAAATVRYTLSAESKADSGVQVVVNNETIVDDKFSGTWGKEISVEPGSKIEFWVFDEDSDSQMSCRILDADTTEVSHATETAEDSNSVQCVVSAGE
ncbi:CD225/dispanin family protein [Klugiella xanthotipulae]|uniref:Interferon-induced transmembrane protein n=1 Tax=Klugiella xanthotipulae TaxID=244735 RepID=A0A543I6A1_9MICO|nr:CD225/dispanin family protein [Klugiella xanthotipulae]TQM66010.1 interferon-induced transmembrane protein [Klugiella xanthotipulae]